MKENSFVSLEPTRCDYAAVCIQLVLADAREDFPCPVYSTGTPQTATNSDHPVSTSTDATSSFSSTMPTASSSNVIPSTMARIPTSHPLASVLPTVTYHVLGSSLSHSSKSVPTTRVSSFSRGYHSSMVVVSLSESKDIPSEPTTIAVTAGILVTASASVAASAVVKVSDLNHPSKPVSASSYTSYLSSVTPTSQRVGSHRCMPLVHLSLCCWAVLMCLCADTYLTLDSSSVQTVKPTVPSPQPPTLPDVVIIGNGNDQVSSEEQSGDINVAAIAGSTVAGIVILLLLVVVAIVMYKRREMNNTGVIGKLSIE